MTTREHISRILELPTKFFVDIGASDDPNESQTEVLVENGWSGIMFEVDSVKHRGLQERMKEKSVVVLNKKVTPENILGYLEENNVPNDFFLSLDIDGYDYFVLEVILSRYKPQFIVSEINEKIPPPIKFTVLYDPSYRWDETHFYGYSISMLEDLLKMYGYKIEELHYNNVILVPGLQDKSIEGIYRDGYFDQLDKLKIFTYNEDFRPIYTMPYKQQIEFIHAKFAKHEGHYAIDGKITIRNTGQIQLSQGFGRWISEYAADTRFQRYLEIGTWNGRGSTCCFYDGFAKRYDTPTLQSYEINKERVQEAAELWKSIPQIKVIRGRVLKDSDCPIYSEVAARFPNVNPEWHSEDVRNFWSCPYVPIEDPEVVLLDGAEYLTVYEFEKVFRDCPSVRVFMLDDTLTAKTPTISAYLLNHPEWNRVAHSETDGRNGWAVFERITVSSEQTPETLYIPVE